MFHWITIYTVEILRVHHLQIVEMWPYPNVWQRGRKVPSPFTARGWCIKLRSGNSYIGYPLWLIKRMYCTTFRLQRYGMTSYYGVMTSKIPLGANVHSITFSEIENASLHSFQSLIKSWSTPYRSWKDVAQHVIGGEEDMYPLWYSLRVVHQTEACKVVHYMPNNTAQMLGLHHPQVIEIYRTGQGIVGK